MKNENKYWFINKKKKKKNQDLRELIPLFYWLTLYCSSITFSDVQDKHKPRKGGLLMKPLISYRIILKSRERLKEERGGEEGKDSHPNLHSILLVAKVSVLSNLYFWILYHYYYTIFGIFLA